MANENGLWTPFSIIECIGNDCCTSFSGRDSFTLIGSQREMSTNSKRSPEFTSNAPTIQDHSDCRVGDPTSPRLVKFSNYEHLAKQDPSSDCLGRGGYAVERHRAVVEEKQAVVTGEEARNHLG